MPIAFRRYTRKLRENSYHPQHRLRSPRLRLPYLVDIPLPSNFQPVSQVPCLALARLHLALAAPKAFHLWSVALFPVLMVSAGIRRVWYAVVNKQRGVVGGE